MLRFAPSPTGDISLEDLRIALLNYLAAKQHNEDIIVRIEDIQKEKNVEGKDQEILDILALFGIEYSHVVYQSQNVRFHSAMALDLLHRKKAFSCFCSDEWLDKKRQEAKDANTTYHYDDACRNLPPELVIDNTAPFSVRIVRPEKPIVIDDTIKGDIVFQPDTVDSFVIMNRDKTPTATFASAVDDMLSDISFIIRSDKHLDQTPKQEHIRKQLGYDKTIRYAHIPSFANDVSVTSLLEQGYLPEAISNYLISIGNNVPQKIFTLNEAKEWFQIDMLTNSPIHFDIDILNTINKEHLKLMDAKELSRYVGFADAEIGELARLYVDEICTTKELKKQIAPIFESRDIPEDYKEATSKIIAALQNAPHFEEYSAFEEYIMQKTDLSKENFLQPLRILLTNRVDGPDIEKIYKYLKNYIREIIK